MSWFVYIIECKDKSFYTGICWNLKKRIKEHNEGYFRSSFTKGRLPVKLVYWKKFIDRFQATRKEKEIKGFGRIKKQKLIDSLHRE
jgi:putative endonuclease